MIEEKEELMVPPTGAVIIPTYRKAHFLKTISNQENQPLPRPHSDLSFTSSPCMNINEVITKRVLFRGRIRQQKDWKTWVEELQQTHQEIWRKAGIFYAIRASLYSIKRHDELIIWLAQKWCPETNTFIFPWAEATMTLEDVLILGGFSVLGVSVQYLLQNPENKEIEKKLVDGCSDIRKNSVNFFVTHNQWMNYFKGCGGEVENAALIALWLSRYVFSTYYYAVISPLVFPIAVSLARGTRLALAPAVLASIYTDLSLLREKIMILRTNAGDDGLDLILWSPLQLLQLWAWERFPTLSPKPTSLAPGEPRLARWHNVKKLKIECLGLDIEFDGDDFVWRPYTLSLENWVFPKFYPDQERWVLVNSDLEEELLSWAQCLRASVLVGMECGVVEQYLPHRVAMQFGMDQHMPGFLPRSNDIFELAWSSYDRPLDGLKLYLPPRLFEGDVTVQYSNWWKDVLSVNNKVWMVYKRRRRSHKQEKKMRTKKLIETASLGIIPSDFPRNLVNEDAQEGDQIVIEGQKAKKLKESHINTVICSIHLGQSKKPPSLDIIPPQFSQNLVNADTQQSEQIGIEEENHLEGSKTVPSMETVSNELSQNLVKKNGQQCEKIDVEEAKRKELERSAGCSSHSDESQSPSESAEARDRTHASIKEPMREPEMSNMDCEGAGKDEQSKDTDEAAPNQEKKKPDNVVIIYESEEDDNYRDPYEMLGDYELEARICRLERDLAHLKAAKLMFTNSKFEIR